jgi:hypothetical protein
MSTAAKVFLGAAAFGAAIGGLYWVVAREPTGTVLLAFFGAAPLIAAVYLWRAARGGPPPEDRPDADPGGFAGMDLGMFATESAWPVIFAGASLLVGVGFVFGIWLLLPAGALFAVATVGLVRE